MGGGAREGIQKLSKIAWRHLWMTPYNTITPISPNCAKAIPWKQINNSNTKNSFTLINSAYFLKVQQTF